MSDRGADDHEDEEDAYHDGFWPQPVEPPLIHDGVPISGWHRGEPVPDLDRIAPERWREVLAPLCHLTRQLAMNGTQSDFHAASILVSEMRGDDGDARQRAESAPPPGMPAGAPPARRVARQVNFRLGPDEHDRLVQAARVFAMRPTTLARVLTVRGVDRALYELRRDA